MIFYPHRSNCRLHEIVLPCTFSWFFITLYVSFLLYLAARTLLYHIRPLSTSVLLIFPQLVLPFLVFSLLPLYLPFCSAILTVLLILMEKYQLIDQTNRDSSVDIPDRLSKEEDTQ